MKRSLGVGVALLAAGLVSTLPICRAQTSSGEIFGRVADRSGAVINGAHVTLRNQQTGDERMTSTGADGLFSFPSLAPGTYAVLVQATGFKVTSKTDLKLSAAQRLAAGNLELEVGAVSEVVHVEAAQTPVQTVSGERSALLDTNELSHLHTPGGDALALVRLLPGVVKDGEGAEQLGTQSAGSVSGTREVSNSISVDGVNGNPRGGGNRFDTPLNFEAISEVKVLLNNYQAEYGQSGGAIVNLTTKSGTQNFHGEGYYYGRNEAMNANDTFNNHQGLPRQRYRYNTFGYNAGGPIYWPGKFNSDRRKLFFFFSQEVWPTHKPGTTRYFMMPTALEKKGDFSQSIDKAGNKVKLVDPKNCGSGNQACLVSPTQINNAFINSNTQALLNVMPTGNPTPLGLAPGGGYYNYVVQATVDQPVDQQVLRLDYHLTDREHVWFRAMRMSNTTQGPTDSPGLTGQMQWGLPFFYKTPARNAAIGVTSVITPTLVNEFTAGYADWREFSGFEHSSDVAKVERGSSTGVLLGQFNPANNPLNLIPNASFGGGSVGGGSNGYGIANAPEINFYTRFPFNNNTGTWEYTDGLTKVLNKHTLKFGIFWQNGRYVQHPIGNQFNGKFTFDVNTSIATDTGYAYANALLGNYGSYNEGTRTVYAPKWRILDWYAQDNWKLTSRLTLDYGMRFSYDFPATLDSGAGVTFVPSRYDPSQVPALYQPVTFSSLNAAQQSLCSAGSKTKPTRCAQNPNNKADVKPSAAVGQFVGPFTFTGSVVNNNPTYPHSLRNSNGVLFAPRLGISFDPWGDGKTAIRAGAGIFYNLREDAGVVGDFSTVAPVISSSTINQGNVSSFTPNCNTLPNGCVSVSSLLGPQDTKIMPINHKIASTMSVNFGIQRDLHFGTVLDVSYVGTFGRHLEQSPNINLVPYLSQFLPQNLDPTATLQTFLNGTVKQQAAKSDNFFRPIPGYGTVELREYTGTSNYNGLQVSVNRRFTQTLEFGGAYTWSKALVYSDNTGGTGTFGGVAIYQDPRWWNYGLASFDRTHNLKVYWVYKLPQASKLWDTRFLRAVADNWEWSGISEFVSGTPQSYSYGQGAGKITLSTGGLNITGGGDGARLILNGTPLAPADARHRTFQYLNSASFVLPPVGVVPSPSMPGITRNVVYRGPGTNNWDMTLAKNVRITERIQFQLRGEAYNVFNHVSFTTVQNTATFNAATGQLVSTGNFGAFTADRDPRILQVVGKITF
jgi:hypothetical protein